jgi:hypothetical protein
MKLQDEIDNHADTCCFGANFTPLYFTGQVCDVSPFTDTYDALQNIEVCLLNWHGIIQKMGEFTY